MDRNIKIIGLDMDGTTLNNQKKITQRVRCAIEQAIAKGVAVLPSTGRTVSGVPKEMLEISGVRYVLVSNGARIYDLQKEESIIEVCMEKDVTADIMQRLEKYDVQVSLYINGLGYALKEDMERLDHFVTPEYIDYFRSSRVGVDNLQEFVAGQDIGIEKVNAVFADMDHRESAKRELMQLDNIAVTSSVSNNLEINHVNANKGQALLSLGELWGFGKEQIMACGDSSNDYTMISKVGLGVVMENADSDLKAIADYITKSNEDDGVAVAIEKFVL